MRFFHYASELGMRGSMTSDSGWTNLILCPGSTGSLPFHLHRFFLPGPTETWQAREVWGDAEPVALQISVSY